MAFSQGDRQAMTESGWSAVDGLMVAQNRHGNGLSLSGGMGL